MRRTSPRVHQRAFTLIEVLIVVAVMGLIGAVVVPQMLRAGTLGVQAAGRMVISDILIAQNDAIASQANRRVVFDTANNSYSVTDEDGNVLTARWRGAGVENYTVNFNTDSRFEGVTIQNVDFGDPPDDVILEFDALGAPTGSGGTLDLIFEETTYRINVARFTGRVTIAPFVATEGEATGGTTDGGTTDGGSTGAPS